MLVVFLRLGATARVDTDDSVRGGGIGADRGGYGAEASECGTGPPLLDDEEDEEEKAAAVAAARADTPKANSQSRSSARYCWNSASVPVV